jgi:glutathione S-transferase
MLKIHGVPISVHTRKVIIAAIEKGLPYHNEPVIPFQPPAGWDRLSPTGKIPVVSDGDFELADSSVICAYLEREHARPALYPAATRDHVQALWLEEYADSTVFPQVIHGLFFQNVIRPKILGQSTDKAAVATIQGEAMPRVFGYLESQVAGDCLVGGKFGIADIAVVSNLINYHYLGYRIEPRFPKLAVYFKAMLRRPSVAQALAAEQPVAAGMGLDQRFVQEGVTAAA